MTAQRPVRCYIAIGSNQGERLALCNAAIDRLAALPQSRLGRRSSWYETEPMIDSAAHAAEREPLWFINGVLELHTTLMPHELIDACLRIERRFGRDRSIRSHKILALSGGNAQLPPVHSSAGACAESSERPPMPPHPEPSPYGGKPPFSRPIDLDLLFYGDAVINEPGLTVPHPRLHLRRFVLEPLAEIAPGLVHPLLRTTIGDLLNRLDDAYAVRRIEPATASPTHRLGV